MDSVKKDFPMMKFSGIRRQVSTHCAAVETQAKIPYFTE
jgi:hypothetical protein